MEFVVFFLNEYSFIQYFNNYKLVLHCGITSNKFENEENMKKFNKADS